MKKTTLSLLTILVFTGCATQVTYLKPNITNNQALEDYRECEYQADLATASLNNSTLKIMRSITLTGDCMLVKGYKRR